MERSLQYCFASRQRTRSTGRFGVSFQCEGFGNCTLANISCVTSNLSIRKGLNFTLCAGDSSGFSEVLPIVNSPPGRETISMPEEVTTSIGCPEAEGSAFGDAAAGALGASACFPQP